MEGDEVEYQAASAGASATYPLQCSALRKGGHVMIKVCTLTSFTLIYLTNDLHSSSESSMQGC